MGTLFFFLHNLHSVLIQELNSVQEMIGIKSTWSRVRAKGGIEQGQS